MDTKENLFHILDMLSEYHPDIIPSDTDTLEDLTEKFIFWMNEYNDGHLSHVNFKWDMHQKEFDALFAPLPERMQDISDYCGAVFFGNLKLEFIRNDVAGGYFNLFEYGAEDDPGHAYSYLEDGTPYEERDPYPTVVFPDLEKMKPEDRPTFTAFAESIEKCILRLLKDTPSLIPSAIMPTDPNKWYPGDHPYKVEEITRDV